MLELVEISYRTNEKEILSDVTMKFLPGYKYAVIGTNGAGKSTIGYVIMGLSSYKPYKGKIMLDGKDITSLTVTERAKLGITLMWQEPARFEGMTIESYLTLGGKLALQKNEVIEAMEFVGLNPNLYLKRFVDKTLSGGERKRVELASIILLKPRYAILDEPDSGIDLMSLNIINDVVNYIAQYGGTPIIITHREEMAYNTDYGYLICAGKVLMHGKTENVLNAFRNTCEACTHPNIPQNNELGK
ncbi:Iron-regulated ABC transporter ATPase subunit SufC [Fervidobacterium changbaicum]|uniref:ABC transporter ATP-binding protein n=1 Tax=Fervidobacterium changbaicum TaxID=310769 RepID=A0AAE5XD26_9BACT|nr:ATP-binding cassette domain-containing protein [Fervidobacterium changbaicum]QAV32300.1 ABC transporter ATP-binding protein [Fervidobacterium changbaicum]QAV34064.1 ABC transporter ATP-binding protein [Fervidobacterium changbaicum]SDH23241.1 Iron-regulated ABC transporter ATPase subunit SufC [Fervidobacterium changbaicum]